MAITEVITKRVTNLTAIGENWNYDHEYPIQSIQFIPGAAADKLMIRDGSTTGAILYYALAPATLNGDQFIKYFHGQNHKPVLVFAECVFSVGHMVIIEKR